MPSAPAGVLIASKGFLTAQPCLKKKNSKAFMNFKQAAVKEFSGTITFKAIYMQMCNKWLCTEGLVKN